MTCLYIIDLIQQVKLKISTVSFQFAVLKINTIICQIVYIRFFLETNMGIRAIVMHCCSNLVYSYDYAAFTLKLQMKQK